MSDDDATDPSTPRRSSGVGTGVLGKVLDHLKNDRNRDAEQQTIVIEALQRSSRDKTWVVIALVIVLAILVAGVVGVSVTGKVPGVGEIEVVQP